MLTATVIMLAGIKLPADERDDGLSTTFLEYSGMVVVNLVAIVFKSLPRFFHWSEVDGMVLW